MAIRDHKYQFQDLNFAEVAVNNRGIGICIQNLGSKQASHRKGAATLISAISQNYPKIQKKTIHLLPLLLKIANDENNQNALRAEVCDFSTPIAWELP